MKKVFIYIFIILIGNISFLFTPWQTKYSPLIPCRPNIIVIDRYIAMPINCDAPSFVGAAINPSYITKENYSRQSRPGYIFLGVVTGYFVYYISYPFHSKIQSLVSKKIPEPDKSKAADKGVYWFSFYSGFIFLNFVILLVSFFLFDKIVVMVSGIWKNHQFLWYLLLFLLSANQLTKFFFWTAHTQLFNILAPLLCIYIGLYIKNHTIAFLKYIVISILSGCLLLVYGNFLLLLPTILFSQFYMYYKQTSNQKMLLLMRSIILCVCFFLPLAIWAVFLNFKGVSLYSSEITKYRQFIWIADTLKISTTSFINTLLDFTTTFITTLGAIIFPLVILVITKLYSYFTKPVAPDSTSREIEELKKYQKKLTGFSMTTFIVFFWLLGFYADRLSFSLVPFLLYYTAVALNNQKKNLLLTCCFTAIILVAHFLLIFFDPTYFGDTYTN